MGKHKHLCTECGLVWEHSNDMAGNVEAHTCTNCGNIESVKYGGRVKAGEYASETEREDNKGISLLAKLFAGAF